MILKTLWIPFISLIGISFLTTYERSLQLLGRIRIKQEFKRQSHYYFFFFLLEKLFPNGRWESLYYLISLTKTFFRSLFAITFFYYLLHFSNFFTLSSTSIITAIAFVLATGLIIEFLTRLGVNRYPLGMLRLSTPLSTFFLLLFFPITLFFLKAHRVLCSNKKIELTRSKLKEKILELVQESELSTFFEPIDRRLITSIASFRERIVREIMVPRIDIFCLSVNQTVHEAAQKFLSEGYSRIPVYKDNMDHIEGVLLYKDVMEYYFMCIEKNQTSPLDTPLEKLVKPVLYSPETKKISHLLQEIRSKQIHLAIVVDEYGGTEGIVTIEDILEELVGEIADEHDIIDEEKLYSPYPSGGWIVDAKITLIDVEKELGIFIPKSPEYDTVGGFVFHRARTIPEKGWKIHSDNFDLEILSSSDRSLEKILLIPPKK